MRAALALSLLVLAGCPRPEGPSQSPKNAGAGDLGAAVGTKPGVPVTQQPPERGDMGTAPVGLVTPPVELPKTVKLRLASAPKTSVRWGKKTLGVTPLVVERPRDSGPLDLVFVARGYFPVHTRAFTFKSDSVHVTMTKLSDRAKLYGAKKEPPPAPVAPPCDPMLGPCPPAPTTPAPTTPTPTTPTPTPAPGSTPPAPTPPPPVPTP